MIGEAAPWHGGNALAEREDSGGDACPEGDVLFGDVEGFDHLGEVGEDGGEGDGFGKAADC